MAEPTKKETWQARVAREKRHAILDAATEEFLANGYDRTTLEMVARSAGVSTGTLFKHFGTKARLFGGIMARAWGGDVDGALPVPAAGDPRAGLTLIGQDYIQRLSEPNTIALFRVIIAEAPRFPELGRELYERGKVPYLERLRAYLAAEEEAGQLRFAAGELALAKREFLGMINDQVFWPHLLIIDLETTVDEKRQVLDSAVSSILARYCA